jgi:hypothetical protein
VKLIAGNIILLLSLYQQPQNYFMRKIPLFSALLLLFSFIALPDPLTDKERKFGVDLLTSTQKELNDITKRLSDAQLKFKPAADKWSVEDCVKHIAVTEMGLWRMTDSIINTSANPEKRGEIKMSDSQVVAMMTDRSFKAKAAPEALPENTPYKSLNDALTSFNENRAKLVQYVQTTDKDLRNHVVAFPMGHFDSFQMIIFIGAHSKRHIDQMKEIMADAGFPKK